MSRAADDLRASAVRLFRAQNPRLRLGESSRFHAREIDEQIIGECPGLEAATLRVSILWPLSAAKMTIVSIREFITGPSCEQYPSKFGMTIADLAMPRFSTSIARAIDVLELAERRGGPRGREADRDRISAGETRVNPPVSRSGGNLQVSGPFEVESSRIIPGERRASYDARQIEEEITGEVPGHHGAMLVVGVRWPPPGARKTLVSIREFITGPWGERLPLKYGLSIDSRMMPTFATFIGEATEVLERAKEAHGGQW